MSQAFGSGKGGTSCGDAHSVRMRSLPFRDGCGVNEPRPAMQLPRGVIATLRTRRFPANGAALRRRLGACLTRWRKWAGDRVSRPATNLRSNDELLVTVTDTGDQDSCGRKRSASISAARARLVSASHAALRRRRLCPLAGTRRGEPGH